ncbi:CRISPR-associated endoribonuclease Cas6 [Gloeocapsa sp. PCC 73106]|uniref:CRISPR-associated endoribonuclease Cas6 n=1 Tax=Gloeocapsa sp. PCC 73106 TaxID=102232 RepID=UPI0002AB99F4|nr:CRISPR-associated endoribonuclease Cas6 [Gloeocapsa sp. PCC 73106]ELR97240.1 CRISPR-associated endoribonuclease Cas6 [Gloeocapsa sp. PCC 73106]
MVLQLPINKQYAVQSFVIELGAAKRGYLPASMGRAIHGCILNWLKIGDAHIAEKIHQSQVSSVSISNLIGYRRQPDILEGDSFYLRICLLDGNLFSPLLEGIETWENQEVILAKFPFVIRQIYTIPDSHNLSQFTDYYRLGMYSPTYQDITLQFLSPTSFKQKEVFQLFPLPELVFNSLLRRWNYFAPTELQFPEIEWQVFVSAFDLKTHALKLQSDAEIGSQGWVKYRFINLEQARIASILAHFAFYAGVGRKTTMGMGQTNLKLPKIHEKHE